MAKLIGTGTNQVPTNGMLGGMAFQTPEDVTVKKIQEEGYNVVTQTDIGTAPNQIPLNQFLGGLAYMDSVAGLDFSATSSASTGTVTSQVLDDYEEGTWTPIVNFGFSDSGFTYSRQEGHYTKIGRQVFGQFRITLTAKGPNTGVITISGLPFIAADVFTSTGIDGQVHIAHDDGFNSNVGANPVSGYVEGGTDYFYFTDRDSTAAVNTLQDTDIDTNFSISGSVIFYA